MALMSTVRLIAVVVAASAAMLVHAQTTQKTSPAPLAGKWEGVRDGGENGVHETVTLIFEVTGKTFTGTMLRQGREFGKISNGVIDGARVTWQVKDLDYSGEISGTTMHVKIDLDNGPIEFDVKKVDKV